MDTALRLLSYVPPADIIYPQRVLRVFPLQELRPQKEYTHGRIGVYLDIQFSEGLSLFIPFDDLIEDFVFSYYDKEPSSVYSHLVGHLNGFRDTLITQISSHGVPPDHVTISACACVMWGQILYVASFGEVQVTLLRQSHSAMILTTGTVQELEGVSGFIELDDVLFIAHKAHDPVDIFAHLPFDNHEADDAYLQSYAQEHSDLGSFYLLKISGAQVPSYDEERLEVSSENEETGVFEVEEEMLADNIRAVYEEVDEKVEDEVDYNETVGVTEEQKKPALKVGSKRVFLRFALKLYRLMLPGIRFFTHQRLVLIGSMLLVLFFGFVFFGRQYEKIWNTEVQVLEEKERLLPQLKSSFAAAEDSLERNPVRAQRMLSELRIQLTAVPETIQNDPEIVDLVRQVDLSYARATRSFKIDSLNSFFDLTTVSAQATGVRLTYQNDAYFISDVAQSAVYRVDAQSRAARALVGSADIENSLIDTSGDDRTLYILSRSGVFAIDYLDSAVRKEFSAFEGWGNVKVLENFGNNLYVLDTEKNQIWKYTDTGSSYGAATNYLPPQNSFDFSQAVDLVIDGFVWVGLADGRVMKFSSGSAASFSLESAPEPLNAIKALFVQADVPYVFVLDDSEGRVVVYSKETGGYVAQFSHESLKGAQDFAYDHEQRRFTVLKGAILYTFTIPEESF